MKYYLAIDLGASSGRHIVGHVENNEIVLDEVHRFKNGVVRQGEHLYWDVDSLFNEIKTGIKNAFAKYPSIECLSIDTWGVDYVLLKGDESVKPTFAYRDQRTLAVIPEVHKIVPFEELYASTGIQFQAFNTIYQLYDDLKAGRLEGVTDFLMLPEYFSYLLTGVKKKEYTDASTGGFVSTKTKQFDKEILTKLGLPEHLFKELSPAGTFVGELKEEIVKEVGGTCKVVLCASHDTASAYEAIDSEENALLLSSGTWSLLGAKIKEASTSKESLDSNFANEGGVGYFRYLKNLMGMWLINEVQRKKGYNILDIVKMAESSSYTELFDVNDESLSAPIDMEEAIKALLKKNGQPAPQNDGDLFCSIYHSLANGYDKAIKNIEKNLNRKYEKLYIVGGGAKNKFLNALTEQYTGKKVVALPIEATAIGNIKVQIKAME